MTRKKPRLRWRVVLDSTIGERGLPTRCAIARDLQEMYPTIRRPYVTDKVIAFTDSETDERITFATPKYACKWVHDFDRNEDPKPEPLILHKNAARVRDATRKTNPPKKPKAKAKAEPKATGEREPMRRRISVVATSEDA